MIKENKKKPSFYLLFIVLVCIFWCMIGLISVLTWEGIGIKPGQYILGALAFFSVKLAWNLTLMLTKTRKL